MRDPSSESGGRRVGRIFDRRGGNLSHLSDPLGRYLLGLKQLLHGHGLVEMVFSLGDLFTRRSETTYRRAPGPLDQPHQPARSSIPRL